MEKPKKEASRFSKKQVWHYLGFMLFVCSVICGAITLAITFVYYPYFGGMPNTSLPPEFIPTAEALLGLPHEVDLFDGDIQIALDIHRQGIICVWVDADNAVFEEISSTSQLFINGAWILVAEYSYHINSPYFPFAWCAAGELQSGIHLIEFHLKDSFWGEPIHIQQWAIEIE